MIGGEILQHVRPSNPDTRPPPRVLVRAGLGRPWAQSFFESPGDRQCDLPTESIGSPQSRSIRGHVELRWDCRRSGSETLAGKARPGAVGSGECGIVASEEVPSSILRSRSPRRDSCLCTASAAGRGDHSVDRAAPASVRGRVQRRGGSKYRSRSNSTLAPTSTLSPASPPLGVTAPFASAGTSSRRVPGRHLRRFVSALGRDN